jgi:hypothetical protein
MRGGCSRKGGDDDDLSQLEPPHDDSRPSSRHAAEPWSSEVIGMFVRRLVVRSPG